MFDNSDYYRNPRVPGDPIAEAIAQLRQDVDELTGKLADETAARIAGVNAVNIKINELPANDHQIGGSRYLGWYHVDNIEGDDENDGSTWETAFKTLQGCIDYANTHGSHDLRIALVESSEPYIYPYAALATGCLHVTGFSRITHEAYNQPVGAEDEPPVKVLCTNADRPFALYCTHANLVGIKFDHVAVTNPTYHPEIYCDGGFVLLQYCKFICRYSQNGGSLWTSGCNFNQMRLDYCNARFYGQTVFPGDALSIDTGIRLDASGCHITFNSNSNYLFAMLGGHAKLFQINNSFVSFGSQMVYSFEEPENIDISWSMDNCVVMMSGTLYSDLTTNLGGYAFTDSCWVQGGLTHLKRSTVVDSHIEDNAFVGG